MITAVLLSGGLDSAVLAVDAAVAGEVQPIYVSVGLAWEAAERATVVRFLASAGAKAGDLRPLVSLSVDMRDVYAATHWALEGRPPAYHTPDEDVYLPGRNVVLLGKAAVYCAASHIDRVVIGTLAHNPFPDATPEFRAAMARALSLGLAHDLAIDAPYAAMSKAEVIRRGVALGVPFELTLSCMSPRQSSVGSRQSSVGSQQSSVDSQQSSVGSQQSAVGSRQSAVGSQQSSVGDSPQSSGDGRPAPLHCGTCSKCRERHDAFVEAGIPDPTTYATTINLA